MTRFALVLAVAALVLAAPGSALAAQPVPISFHSFSSATDFSSGSFAGAVGAGGSVTLASGQTTGSWTSPWFDPQLAFTELVSSWNVDTPPGTWLEVRMQGVTDRGTETKWYVMGRWAYGDETILRTSVGGQGDADGYVAIDTFFAKDHPLTRYRLQVTLFRTGATVATPTLRSVGAVASNAPNEKPAIPSAPGVGRGIELAVPTYSQEIHAGEYPQYDGGGEAWCSPTSTAMVVAYFGAGPTAAETSWVGYPDPWVDYTARYTYDYHYHGTGNWPFNTAYAAARGLDAEVTQLRSLAEAEQFIAAGIPLVASIAANPNKLTGFLFDKGTNGHLLVIVGFTAGGDPIVNDPASTSDATVRHVYDRAEFERAWLPATGGIVYVIHPENVPLPASLGGNW